MKKILILMMSCYDEFFEKQEELAKQTWAKDICDGKYENIDFLAYKGSTNKHSIDWNTHVFNVRCEDGLDSTFKKTYYVLSIINKKFDYDYVFRCNTSTYVNVELLNAFVQSLPDDNKVLWCSELYSLSEGFCPYPLYLFGRGNGLLMSKYIVDLILSEGINFIYLSLCDDWNIGNILNSYWIKKGKNYLDYIKSYPHGWYKCINTDSPNKHTLCGYHNDSLDFNFMKNFVTIQTKRYHERELENANSIELYDKCFKGKSNENIEDSVNKIYEYSKNPNIFIGSILGYITLEDWKKVDKPALYDIQRRNKADDDEQRFNKDKILL